LRTLTSTRTVYITCTTSANNAYIFRLYNRYFYT
jgi:hypothetical protein